MLSNEELNFVYKVASDIIEIKEFLISNNRNMSSVLQNRKLSFPTADNGGSDDPCCNTLDIDYLNGTCGEPPPEDPCPEGYNKCSGGSDGTWCMPDDGTPCYSYICQQAVCKQVSYSTYLFTSLQACQAYCQTTTPDPTLPPPNIFYYKCESGSCIDCSQDPSSCADKDCDSANYYCSPIKDRAESNCERECDSPPPTCETSFAVDCSSNSWQDTGVTITEGASVSITATGTASWNTSGGTATPDGLTGTGSCFCCTGCSPMPGECHMKLIGRISGGSPFAIGSSYSGSPGAGTLELRQNDSCVMDNSGTYSGTITTDCPYPSFMFVSEDRISW